MFVAGKYFAFEQQKMFVSELQQIVAETFYATFPQQCFLFKLSDFFRMIFLITENGNIVFMNVSSFVSDKQEMFLNFIRNILFPQKMLLARANEETLIDEETFCDVKCFCIRIPANL